MFQSRRDPAKLMALAILIAVATVGISFAQDKVGAPGALQSGPPNPLGWLKFALDLGVPGVLSIVIWKLWGHYKKKDEEFQADKLAWVEEKATLKESREKATDMIWAEARKDKKALRESTNKEKAQAIRESATRVDALQGKLDQEQKDRREEAERLLREQNVLTREVVETAQAMTESLRENTRVVEKLDDSMKGMP